MAVFCRVCLYSLGATREVLFASREAPLPGRWSLCESYLWRVQIEVERHLHQKAYNAIERLAQMPSEMVSPKGGEYVARSGAILAATEYPLLVFAKFI